MESCFKSDEEMVFGFQTKKYWKSVIACRASETIWQLIGKMDSCIYQCQRWKSKMADYDQSWRKLAS